MIKRLVCLIIPLLFTACTPEQSFQEGQREYVAGNYIQAAAIFSQYNTMNSDIKFEAMYYEGLCWYKVKNYARAEKLLTSVIEHSHNRMLKAQAIDAKAEMMLDQGNCQSAVSLYKMLVLGYADIYPQNDAYRKLKTTAVQCGTEEVLDDVSGQFEMIEETQVITTSANTLKRVRLDTHFTTKEEAVTVMKTLQDSGVESSLIKIQTPDNTHYLLQVGAFSSSENATKRALEVKNLGWKVIVVE